MKRIFTILLMTTVIHRSKQQLLESYLKFLSDGTHDMNIQIKDQINLLPEYDFIVVGAGTAGCAVAARLSENPDWKILLLEAGGAENLMMDVPILVNYLQFTEINWKYKTEPSGNFCLGMENNQCNWPRGKVMGGSSVLNYMIHTRGHKKDYDRWEDMGNPGWGWDEVLPYFIKLEDFQVEQYQNSSDHQTGGPVGVSYAPYHTKLAEAIVNSSIDIGMKYIDYNTGDKSGVSYIQASLRDGTRSSASRSYLYKTKTQGNLHVSQRSHVKKILIDPKTLRAYGVEFVKNGKTYSIKATKEVIVSGGTINSAQLLMLSGLGPKKHLKQIGIPVLKNLKVGYNLQDHIAAGGLTFMVDQADSLNFEDMFKQEYLNSFLQNRTGPLTVPGGCEVITYNNLKDPFNTNKYPDIELLFVAGSVISDPLLYKNFGIKEELFNQVYGPIKGRHSFMVFPMLLKPKSIGRIVLKNSNYKTKPMIFPNYLADRKDIDTIVKGIRLTLDIANQSALQKLGTKFHTVPIPDCEKFGFGSDKYWECHIRYFTFTIYHHSGTCKMGPDSDRDAVVDPRLRVHGIKGLRVIDASIIPEIPTAHTNVPTYMIGEKGADMIKEDWGFIVSKRKSRL